MVINFKSFRRPCVIRFKVSTKVPTKLVIKAMDFKKPHTLYRNSITTITKPTEIIIRMPQSPEAGMVEIYNPKNGNLPTNQDLTFRVTDLKIDYLKQSVNVFDSYNNGLKSFIKFAQQFSDRCSIISATLPNGGASVYYSDDGKFRIDFVDVIRDRKSKQPLSTPSRISQLDGVIEVSRKHFLNYTVPMRMAILLHEYAHFYMNRDPRSEVQADKNALLVYLGMGYPRIEAYQAWLDVFIGSPTDQNRERYDLIKKYIDDFEKSSYALIG